LTGTTTRLTEIEDALRIALSWVPNKHAGPPTEALDALLALVTQLHDALRESLDFAEEGWGYAPDYFREKWGSEDEISRLRALAVVSSGGPTEREDARAADQG
jgi:hypothetical protein